MKFRSFQGPIPNFPLILAVLGLAWTSQSEVLEPNNQPFDPHYFRHWQTEEGLPQNSANTIAQTADGYLWIGTFQGLTKFDGIQFESIDETSDANLPSLDVFALFNDSRNRLWIATEKNLALWENDLFTLTTPDFPITSDPIPSLAELPDGRILVAYGNQPIQVADGSTLTQFPVQFPGNPTNKISVFNGPNQKIWAYNSNQLSFLQNDSWQPYLNSQDLQNQPILHVAPGRNHTLWILTQTNLIRRLGDQTIRQIKIPAKNYSVTTMMEDRQGGLWLATWEHGLFHISTNGYYTHYTKDRGLNHNTVRSVFEDREGNIWAGTDGGGLTRFRHNNFLTYGEKTGLQDTLVKSVSVDPSGAIWVGTHGGGLACLKDGQFSHPIDPKTAGGSWIWSVLVDRKNRLWWGTLKHGLWVRDNEIIREVPLGLPADSFVSVLKEDAQGEIWIGTRHGLFHYGTEGRVGQDKLPPLLRKAWIKCLATTPDGSLWVVTGDSEVARLRDDQFEMVVSMGDKLAREIRCLFVEDENTLWMGTQGQGVFRMKEGKTTRIHEEDGLPSPMISRIFRDDLGGLWVCSSQGILRTTLKHLHEVADGKVKKLDYHLFNRQDGLETTECCANNEPNHALDSEGKLWLATPKGLAMVNPHTLQVNHLPPRVLIKSIQFVDGDKESRIFNQPLGNSFTLPAGSGQLVIDYTATSLSAPEKVMFYNKLTYKGKTRYTKLTPQRSVLFHDLSPGDYTFEVTAANNDGVWNRTGTALSFVIQPFFWETTWFLVLASLSLVGLVGWTGWRTAHGRVQRKLNKLKHERKISSLQKRLSLVLENTSDAVAFASPDRKPFYANQAARRLVGLSKTEDLSAYITKDFYADWAYKIITDEALPTVNREGIWRGESAWVNREGEEIPLSQVMLAHRSSDDGKIEFISSIARDISKEKKAEEQILQIAHGVSAETGDTFFKSLVEHLAKVLEADYAFVSKLVPNHPDRARTTACYALNRHQENFEYAVAGTPCEKVLDGEIKAYECNVMSQFPGDEWLKEMQVEGYVGVPLFSMKSAPLGILVVMYKKPIPNVDLAKSMLNIFGSRASAELERVQIEANMRDLNASLECRVRERTAELQRTVNLMAGREIRMSNLKDTIRILREQLEEAHLQPLANDPLEMEGNDSLNPRPSEHLTSPHKSQYGTSAK